MKVPEKLQKIADVALAKKAEDVVAIEVGEKIGITSYFLIMTVNSPPQADAIIDEIEKTAKELSLPILGTSGTKDSQWILIDLGDYVVHLFQPEARNFYRLENLWGDCPQQKLPLK